MAEPKKSSSSRSSSRKSSPKKSSPSKSSSSKSSSSNGRKGSSDSLSPREIVRGAVRQLQELIGRPVEGVLAIEKDDDGDEWAVSVEVLELERVPNTTDVLGKYEVKLDSDGDVIAAKRTRRYLRSQSGED